MYTSPCLEAVKKINNLIFDKPNRLQTERPREFKNYRGHFYVQ
jgi:hypothetical protein